MVHPNPTNLQAEASSRRASRYVPALRCEEVLRAPRSLWVDLRSPGEFAGDHAPGAVNLPLFDDDERKLIGTLYARQSPQTAFEEGRLLARARIEELVRSIARHAGWNLPQVDLEERLNELSSGGIQRMEGSLEAVQVDATPADPVVFSCWRGGLRSRAVVALLRGLGLPAYLIEGGYKAYRAHVRAALEGWQAPPVFVLRGWTGVGKTLVLNEIERLRPGWTVDLEALAGHRSSVLGMVGRDPVSQKAFESGLLFRFSQGFPGPCLFEGESRKVGDAILPPLVWTALQEGTNICLEAGQERRVQVLIEDYLEHDENRVELARQLPFLEERLGSKWKGELVDLLKNGREAELVAVLLERYYDPLYRHSEKGRKYASVVDATDPKRAAGEVVAWVEGKTG